MIDTAGTGKPPRIVIVGAGFGGVAAARKLAPLRARVTLLDRRNHYLFQPLLYQIATAKLTSADIASPTRRLFSSDKNVEVLMSDVTGIDTARSVVASRSPSGEEQEIPFDHLVIATGARHSYFGHNDYAKYAPGLKTLADASSIRGRILKAFEIAEADDNIERRCRLLTFVLIGAGPTGVEMAGAIAELRRYTLRHDFRRIDPTQARILLVEAGPRILGSFHETLSAKAQRRLEELGVEVRLGKPVEHVGEEHIVLDGETIYAHNIVWTAGVEPSPAAHWLGAVADSRGRVKVNTDCSVPGHPNIFVIGDTAYFDTEHGPLPGVAQVAMQQGYHVGGVIAAELAGHPNRAPFRYDDRGNMAVIGRNFAVLERGNIRMAGFFAWLGWVFIHIVYLASLENRFAVFATWAWSYFNQQRISRLIIEPDTSAR